MADLYGVHRHYLLAMRKSFIYVEVMTKLQSHNYQLQKWLARCVGWGKPYGIFKAFNVVLTQHQTAADTEKLQPRRKPKTGHAILCLSSSLEKRQQGSPHNQDPSQRSSVVNQNHSSPNRKAAPAFCESCGEKGGQALTYVWPLSRYKK